jgi:hypothetical protein
MTVDPETLRQVQAAKTRAMSRDEKVAFLKSRGWRRARGNHWERSRDGFTSPLANAVRLQLIADLEESG